MYKIGEFSKITNITIKALRYYEEEKILSPSSRLENGYRIYDEQDYQKAQLIHFLRDMNFSISEIKDIVSNYETQDDLQYFLSEKKEQIENKIMQEKELIHKINAYLVQNNNKEMKEKNYKFETKEIAPVNVLSIRYSGVHSDVGIHIGRLYKNAKAMSCGAPFTFYHDEGYKKIADIEICIPIKGGNPIIVDKDICYRQLPGIRAICTLHNGGYDKLNIAYKNILDYAAKEKLVCEIPSREIYHKGPGSIFKGNPDNYVTEIIVPIKEEK